LATPWQLVGRDEAGNEVAPEAAAILQIRSLGDCVLPLAVGSVPLTFRPRRAGSHRSGKTRYDAFTEQDLNIARVLASGPELTNALIRLISDVPLVLGTSGRIDFSHVCPERADAYRRAWRALAKISGQPGPFLSEEQP
jgi:hypothetical protein